MIVSAESSAELVTNMSEALRSVCRDVRWGVRSNRDFGKSHIAFPATFLARAPMAPTEKLPDAIVHTMRRAIVG